MRFSIQLYSESVNQKVKVIQYIEPYKPYKDSEAILLTTNSNTFAQDGIVTLFQEKNGCEVFIATGQIINIQQNGKVQIVIPKSSDSDFNWENIKRNEKDQLDKLIIKTIVTTRLLGGN